MELIDTGTTIQIAYEGELKNLIMAQSLADFPAPVSGVTTTSIDDVYRINGMIDMGTVRISGDFLSVGLHPAHDGLIYSGTGDMFTVGAGGSLGADSMTLDCPNGRMVNHAGNGGFLVISQCLMSDIADLGVVGGVQLFDIKDCLLSGCLDGFSFTGATGGRLLYQGNTVILNEGTMLALGTSIHQNIAVRGNQSIITGSGQTFMSGVALSANVDVLGLIEDNGFSGPGTILDGIELDALKWRSNGNLLLPDTRISASTYISTAAATTSISATPVVVNGTYTPVDEHEFEVAADGRITYLGIGELEIPVTYNLYAEPASGNNREYAWMVGVGASGDANPTPIPESTTGSKLSNAAAQSIPVQWDVTLNTGDYVYLMVAGVNGTTTNVTAQTCTGRVK